MSLCAFPFQLVSVVCLMSMLTVGTSWNGNAQRDIAGWQALRMLKTRFHGAHFARVKENLIVSVLI
jgi:hypothetical protein